MKLDRRTWLKFTAAGASLAGAGAAGPASAASTPAPTVTVLSKGAGGADYSATLTKVADYMSLHLKAYGLPGMTFCLADKEGFAATINAGWANVDRQTPLGPDELFQVGSISKSFAAICILKAAAAGKLHLDDAVADLLPEVPLPPERITVRLLLTHASGLPDDAPIFPHGGDQHLWLGYAPGARFSYSNTGYALLGLILERVHGRPYGEIVRTEVLSPLGMTTAKGAIRTKDIAQYAVGYWPLQGDRPFPQGGQLGAAMFTEFWEASGCVAATANEMVHYVRYLIAAGAGKGAPLLSDRDAAAFTTPYIEAPVFGPGSHYTFGLGVVSVNGRPLLHHTGGMMSFSSSMHIDPAAGVGAFASTNARVSETYRPRDVTAYACELMLAARVGATAPAAPKIQYDDQVAKAADYAGRYETAGGEVIVLAADGDKLRLTYPKDGTTVTLRVMGEDAFLVPHPRFERLLLVFERQAGAPVRAWWRDTLFAKDPAKRQAPEVPPALAALAGRYVDNDPWKGDFWVIARGDGLWIDGTDPLVPLGDGAYRVGKNAWDCERVRFEAMLGGRPQRLLYSGVEHDRMSAED